MYPDTCQAGVDDDDYYIPELGNVLQVTMIENSSDPRLLLNMNGFRGLISNIYICMYGYCDILSKHVSCVLSGHFRCNSQKQQTGYPVDFVSYLSSRPYDQPLPLNKCEQLDLKHSKTML